MRSVIFLAMLLTMLGVTVWASLNRGMLDAGGELMSFPWFIATLTDAYLAFLAFYICVIWQNTRGSGARAAWLLAVLCLGSMALAAYVLVHGKSLVQRDAAQG